MRQSEKNYKRIVIKIGSSLFYEGGTLNTTRFWDTVSNIGSLIKLTGKEVIIVSSGAIALGMSLMKLKTRPKELPMLQATAAIGQNALMDDYSKYFRKYGIICAQVLLTWDDFDNRQRYLNAKNTLLTLLKLGAVPIINENDTISTDEIKFGDNDRLSALVATLINADLLVIFSDVDGLLDKNKKVIKVIDEITSPIKALACPTNKKPAFSQNFQPVSVAGKALYTFPYHKKTSVGGMVTKIEAAKIAMDSGIPCVIAKGGAGRIIFDIIRNPAAGIGTLFLPKISHLAARERWIAFGTKSKGKVIIDDGAKKALINKKSLLSVGVVRLEGDFEAGDIVSVQDLQGNEFARGKAGISSKQLDKVKGSRFDKEIIHRDNIVIL